MRESADVLVLPELTRGLRHFATPSALGSDHAVYFAPLITSRRAAHEAVLWTGRLAAFDANRLRGAWEEMLGALAASRFSRVGPDRRALTAELEDATVHVFAAFDVVAHRAVAVRGATDERARAAAWGPWVDAVRGCFAAADDAWGAIVPVLADSRGSSGRWWRRVIGGAAR